MKKKKEAMNKLNLSNTSMRELKRLDDDFKEREYVKIKIKRLESKKTAGIIALLGSIVTIGFQVLGMIIYPEIAIILSLPLVYLIVFAVSIGMEMQEEIMRVDFLREKYRL